LTSSVSFAPADTEVTTPLFWNIHKPDAGSGPWPIASTTGSERAISDFDSAGFQPLVTRAQQVEGTLFQKFLGSRRRILADGERDGEQILSEAVEQFGVNGGRAEDFMALAHGGASLTVTSMKLGLQTMSREQKLEAMHEI
jgi:hypothetical protein